MADRRSPKHEPPFVVILWAGALLIALGILGYLVEPRLALVWAIFLFFGIATVPQTISMALAHRWRSWKRHIPAWQPRRRGKNSGTGNRRG